MKKKPATLSDKLNKLFAPDEHSEQSDEETAPKVSEFDETPDDGGKNPALSEFRKRNFQFLEDLDRKYKGAVSSRSETFVDEDVEEESDEESDEADDDFDGEDDSEEDEEESDGNDGKMSRKHKPKSLVLLKPPQSDDDSEENDDSHQDDEEGSEDSTDDEQEFLGDYADSSKTQQITLVREENRQDTINKGLAVQNQLKVWERLLEMRIKVQPCLIASNGLPPSSSICRNLASKNEEFRQKSDEVAKTVSETLEQMLELQELLLGRYSETKDLLKSGSKRKASSLKNSNAKQMALDGYGQILASRCKDMEEYRNSVLTKWHDRTNIASKMRNNPKQSLSVLKKIEDSLINREELVRKTQLYRGGYTLLGRQIPSTEAIKPAIEERDATEEPTISSVYDGEIFEDSDFYHQMLRELIEYKTSTTDSPQEIANKLAELQKLRNKMKKIVDTKASKGRKIRYVVHNKLVSFMAPVPDHDWTDEAKDELFGSLFGQTPTTEEG
uniref:Apoptosis antagonizing transcription factor/protein transport protein n=1 Tax=Anopheles minimus TaxID=112268 RepID=A0A182WJC7_9DIPT